MRRQLQPSHLKVPPGPHGFPQRHCLGEGAAIVNHYSPTEKSIPGIPSLPGFRTSATFLTSLSANLRIEPDSPSPLPTPATFRICSSSNQPLPSPLSLAHAPVPSHEPYPSPPPSDIMSSTEDVVHESTADELPRLSTYTALLDDDRFNGLHLVADSVAQQRQLASKILILHPILLATFIAVAAVAAQYVSNWYNDKIMLGTTLGGLVMIFLSFVRWMTGPYLGVAEQINADWLGQDQIIVVKWGEDIIGALVLGWADGEAARKKGRRRRGKVVIRAWTVRLKYRGKGVGKSLLEEAVKIAGEKGADGIVFDAHHANSKRILPNLFNGFLDKQEAKAEKALRKVADEKGNFRQRQGSPTWGSR